MPKNTYILPVIELLEKSYFLEFQNIQDTQDMRESLLREFKNMLR
jgi:hypothetical protein